MLYQEYIPSKPLLPYIDTYWVAKNHGSKVESRILPDGFIDIVFDLNRDLDTFLWNRIRVSGMMTSYRNIISEQHSETFGIRFKPGKLSMLSNFPFSEIKNDTINASEILSNLNTSLLEVLIDMKNQFVRINHIETVLIRLLEAANIEQHHLIPSVCDTIENDYKAIDLVKIANQHHISLRQLERRFKAAVGVTMKEYHAIVRFKKTIESISKHPNKSLLHTAFDHGYFDHAHLTKVINKMSGLNPSQM